MIGLMQCVRCRVLGPGVGRLLAAVIGLGGETVDERLDAFRVTLNRVALAVWVLVRFNAHSFRVVDWSGDLNGRDDDTC